MRTLFAAIFNEGNGTGERTEGKGNLREVVGEYQDSRNDIWIQNPFDKPPLT